MNERDSKGKFTKGNQIGKDISITPPVSAPGIVRELAAKGCSEISIAKALGVCRDTYCKWRDNIPEIREAWEQGRAKEHDALVDALFESATKQKNVTAAIFLLKARHGYRENADITVENKVAITFEVPGALKPDIYDVEVLKKAIPKKKLKELTDGQ